MSFQNSDGIALALSSPNHIHHVDVSGAMRTLRRSLSRSPSKFNLRRVESDVSAGSDASAPSSTSSPQSPCERASAPPASTGNPSLEEVRVAIPPPSTPSVVRPSAPHLFTSTPLNGSSFRLSVRSVKSSRTAPQQSRPVARPRLPPRSPLKRALSVSSNSGNSAPSSSSEAEEKGAENHQLPVPSSPLPRKSADRLYRHSLHIDPSGASQYSVFRSSELGNPGFSAATISSALKRTDATMDLDYQNHGSPVAKRRSLHGISGLGQNEQIKSIFDSSTTPPGSPAFNIHDDHQPELQSLGSGTISRDAIGAIPPRQAAGRRPDTPRKLGTQHQRGSMGRRTGSQQLAQMRGEASTTPKTRPPLSMDSFSPPVPPKDGIFSNGTLPSTTTYQADRSHQPHPLSKALGTLTSGSGVEERQTRPAPTHRWHKDIAPADFSKSLPLPNPQRGFSGFEAPVNLFTPVRGGADGRRSGVASTGLVSKMNKNPEQELPSLPVPDTPCKKHISGFNTFPPRPSVVKKPNRLSLGAGRPSESLKPNVTDPVYPMGESSRAISRFMRSGHIRRSSILSTESVARAGFVDDDGDIDIGDNHLLDFDSPGTPTRASLSFGFAPSGDLDAALGDDANTSPSASRSYDLTRSTRQDTSSKSFSGGTENGHRTPQAAQEAFVGLDASRLSISRTIVPAIDERRGSMPPPLTPTAIRAHGHHSLTSGVVTPTSRRSPVDESLASRFDTVDPLGKGEFSTVFRVTKFTPSPTRCAPKTYAVKISRQIFLGPRDRDRRLREVRILRALRGSDHILQYVNSWTERGQLYIQTEFCEEGTLTKFLNDIGAKGRMDDFRIWKIFHDLSLGLKAIHDAGFIHLDLKPDNVLISFDGVLKIGDFGMATTIPPPDDADSEGDKRYFAPEIMQGHFDKPADIFALGLTVVEMGANIALPGQGIWWARFRHHEYLPEVQLTVSEGTSPGLASEDMDGIQTRQKTPHESHLSEGFSRFGSPRNSALSQAPAFMVHPTHPSSLDTIVSHMLQPGPDARPNIDELLKAEGLAWVARRRLAAATVYEGNWGPADEVVMGHDSTMTGVDNVF